MVEYANRIEFGNKEAKKEPRTLRPWLFWLMTANFLVMSFVHFLDGRERAELKKEIARLEREIRKLKVENDIRPRLY
jgi:hypothetical protein